MNIRVYEEGVMYVIGASEGSMVLSRSDGTDELILFEDMPGGSTVERRLPCSVVLKAAHREFLGLRVLEEREPWPHPEVELACPEDPSSPREGPSPAQGPRLARGSSRAVQPPAEIPGE